MTGGSRGVGAATARALAAAGYDVALTYRDKARRAEAVAAEVRELGGRVLCARCDITAASDRSGLRRQVEAWAGGLDLLVLNASGGLEKKLVGDDPTYPMRINRDAQVAMAREFLDLLRPGAEVQLITSHWAHLYGRVVQLPAYTPVAASKHAGELALRDLQPTLLARGVRLVVVTGDLIEGTITARLLERRSAGTTSTRRDASGSLPSVDDLAAAVVSSAADPDLPSGATMVVGGSLEDLLEPGVITMSPPAAEALPVQREDRT